MRNYDSIFNDNFSDSDKILVFGAIILLIFGVILLVLMLARISQKKEEALRDYVRENSAVLKKLKSLNEQYDFQHDIQSSYTYYYKTCKTKTAYDTANIEKYALEIISKNCEFFAQKIEYANNNNLLYEDYCKQAQKLFLEINENEYVEVPERKKEKCKKIEQSYFNQNKIVPITKIAIRITKTYSSPQGRNYYRQDYDFSQEKIIKLIGESIAIEEHKHTAQYQRSILTPSMRYDVLKRDGFRCVLCGASSNDGVTRLEVDHIIPVSKGGLTKMSNLRTLCHNCNSGKSDKYTADEKN